VFEDVAEGGKIFIAGFMALSTKEAF